MEGVCDTNIRVADSEERISTTNVAPTVGGCNNEEVLDEYAMTYQQCSTTDTPLLTWLGGGGSGDMEAMDKTLRINGIYPNKESLKETLQLYALHNKFQFKTKTSNPDVIHVICYEEKCKWAVRGVRMNKSDCFEVRRFDNVHRCSIDSRLSGNRQASALIIGKMIKHQYLDASRKPYQPKAIMADLNWKLGVNVNYKKAWRAEEKALTSISGTDKESYMKLPMLCHIIDQENPASIISLNSDSQNNFKNLFMS
ncbi:unnamed protein product, partial [Cuscuta europaea]